MSTASAPSSNPTTDRVQSVAITEHLAQTLESHLLRPDGQEDLTFALYRSSSGLRRDSAVIADVVYPEDGDRQVHGNASFNADYYLRAASLAAERNQGLALLHSHPRGFGWQRLSKDDDATERGLAVQTLVLTGKPLIGLTLAGRDTVFSARAWPAVDAVAHRTDAESVRVVGSRIRILHNPDLRPPPAPSARSFRTLSAWGLEAHQDLVRIRVGVVGAGSVGAVVGEVLARTGFIDVVVIDFDNVEERNLDRLLSATADDARNRRSKSELLASSMAAHAADTDALFSFSRHSVVEIEGWAEALDCDVLFSCVDRPWPRHALNLAAYGSLIPVVDGGIVVDVVAGILRGAEWRSHIVGPGRRCLACIGQFDPAHVSVEQAGLLDDPVYIAGLEEDHYLRRGENVMAFSSACGSHEVLDLLRAVLGPGRQYDIGATIHHWTLGDNDHELDSCHSNCPYAAAVNALTTTIPSLPNGGHERAALVRAESGTRPLRGCVRASEAQSLDRKTSHGRIARLGSWLRSR